MLKIPSTKMSKDTRNKILKLWRLGFLHQHQIASLLGLNQGRVSEVVNAMRRA